MSLTKIGFLDSRRGVSLRCAAHSFAFITFNAFVACLVVLATPLATFAQDIVSASPDVTIDLGASVIAADEDVTVDNQFGVVVLENLGALPSASEVIALGFDVNGDRLLAFETTTPLVGGVFARPGDVIRYDGVVYSIEFDASSAGLPSGVATDAVSRSALGLLLSFDTTVDLGGGLVAADEDLVERNGSSFVMAFDGSAMGLDSALDVDGAQDVGGGSYLMSFDTSGQIGGIFFDDEDVLRFDGLLWSLEFDASAANSAWSAADLDAVMVPEPGAISGLLAGCGLLAGLVRRRPVRAAGASVIAMAMMLSAPAVRAVDGVAEISEACAVQTGCFSGDTAGYPVTIDGSAGGAYRLTSNLIVPNASTNGITISTSDISVDLNGFAIIRSDCVGITTDCTAASGVGNGVEQTGLFSNRGVTLTNGRIVGMGNFGARLGEQAVVSDLGVRWCRSSGVSTFDGSSVTGTTVYENGVFGIVGTSGSTVSGNTAYKNGNDGIHFEHGSTVTGNVAYQNGLRGLLVSFGSVVSGNTAYENGSHGISANLGSLVHDNVLRDNIGFGLSPVGAAYRDNVITGTSTVSTAFGGVDLLGNSCNGATTCP